MSSMDRIALAYSPALAERVLKHLGERFSEHLAGSLRGAGPVLPWCVPAENATLAGRFLDAGNAAPCVNEDDVLARFLELLDAILSRSINLHHPRYVGHQVAPPPPLAAVFDAVSSLTNQGAAIYEMGPWAAGVERALIAELAQAFGLPREGFTGFATHGGSLGNLTALLTARSIQFPEAWQNGFEAGRQPVLLVHADAHYCVSRAAGILGIGTSRVIELALDGERRMDVGALRAKLADVQRERIPVLAVVACACTTMTGAFDRLNEVADVCRDFGVWLHVDAAHGGAVALSSRHRYLLAGIERADSFVCDAHKMMFAPALCAFVFHRHPERRFATFAQEASYLYDPTSNGDADFDHGLLTVECTKRAMTYTLWGLWSLLGPGIFEDLVDRTFDLAGQFAAELEAAEDFQLLHRPESNIVVFRYVPAALAGDAEGLGTFNRRIRREIIESGRFYFVQTTLEGSGALRAVVMNPLTTVTDLRDLMDEIRQVGQHLLRSAATR